MFPFNCFSPLKTLALVEFEGGISGQHSGDIFSLWIKFQTWQKQKQGKKCILLIVSWFNSWTDLQVVPYLDLLERRNPTTVLLHSYICGYIQNYEWTKTFNSSWQLPHLKDWSIWHDTTIHPIPNSSKDVLVLGVRSST